MKMTGVLTGKDIEDAISASVLELERAGIDPDMRLRFRLSFEEILILFKEAAGGESRFTAKTKKSKGDFLVILSVAGEKADPFQMESPLLGQLIGNMDNKPGWEYLNGENVVTFRFTLYNSPRRNYAFAWRYVSPHKKILFISIAIQFISVGLGVLAPILSARIIVRFMNNQPLWTMSVAGILLLVQATKNLLLVRSNKGYNRVYCDTLSSLEGDLVMSALKIKNRCMEEKGSGLFIQRLTGDTTRMATGFGRIADMTAQAVNYIGIILAMFYIDVRVALMALALLVIESMIETYRTRRLYRDDRVYRNANELFSGFIGEMVRGARDVKQLNSEEAFKREAQERVMNANDKRFIMQENSWNIKLIRWEFSEIGTFLFIAILATFMGKGWLPAATVIVLYNYYSSLDVRAITLAGEFMEYIKDFNLSVERVCAIMNSPEFPKEKFGDVQLKDPRGEIVFDKVTFGYESDDPAREAIKVLDEMDFRINAGEMVAFVGRSGCGKTTVLNLLSRLYDPQKGKIYLDGEDIRTLTKDSVRGTMAVVNQAPYIFNMSVKDNLMLAKEDMTDEEMKEVCRLACIDDDIEKMSAKYDTVIGEGGVNLSGGQRQRLAIARSLLKEHRIILFDEATSALDNVTQAKIQKAINAIRKERTVILIAHRLSTVMQADRIMYMADGKILAAGKHEELLKTCEPYRQLYQEEAGEQNKNA